jgi:hypothetical protein
MMIGYLGNNVFPARMGEVLRIYALERTARVSKSRAAASIVLERGIDGLWLVVIVGLVSLMLPLPAVVRQVTVIAAPLFVALAILIAASIWKSDRVMRGLTRAAGRVSPGLGRAVGGVLDRAVQGLSVLGKGSMLSNVLFITFVIWAIEAAAVMVATKAVGLELPWVGAWLLTAMLGLGAVIPAAPGGLGTYEFLAVSALGAFAVEPARALGFAVLLHLVTYGTSTGLGVACMAAESWSMRKAYRTIQDG